MFDITMHYLTAKTGCMAVKLDVWHHSTLSDSINCLQDTRTRRLTSQCTIWQHKLDARQKDTRFDITVHRLTTSTGCKLVKLDVWSFHSLFESINYITARNKNRCLITQQLHVCFASRQQSSFFEDFSIIFYSGYEACPNIGDSHASKTE